MFWKSQGEEKMDPQQIVSKLKEWLAPTEEEDYDESPKNSHDIFLVGQKIEASESEEEGTLRAIGKNRGDARA